VTDNLKKLKYTEAHNWKLFHTEELLNFYEKELNKSKAQGLNYYEQIIAEKKRKQN
jgi:hypothetical protein